MRIGSLFAGMGGFDVAAEAMGWSTAWVSEIDPFACAVLANHFPDAPNLGDVTTVNWNEVEPIDVLCAGFPCQPHSLAGKRKASDDERDLWAEVVRAAGVLRPRYVVGENVAGLLTSESGRFLNRVVSDLAALGYAVEYSLLSAAAVGAPHKRERIWIVASLADTGREQSRNREANASVAERGMARTLESGDRREHRIGSRGDSVDDRHGGRREQRHASERSADVAGAGHDAMGDADRARLQGHGRPVGVDESERRDTTRRLSGPSNVRLRDWRDAVPVRGADGTVRLVPAAAVGHGTLGGRGTGAGVELQRTARGCEGVGDASRRGCGGESRRGSGQITEDGHGGISGREAEGPRPEPSLRAVADGLPDGLAGRGGGASLWPVTETEPGRVAKLRAIGNAIVPLCAVMGPFARIAELEAALQEAA